jgi:hypothetical protein
LSLDDDDDDLEGGATADRVRHGRLSEKSMSLLSENMVLKMS